MKLKKIMVACNILSSKSAKTNKTKGERVSCECERAEQVRVNGVDVQNYFLRHQAAEVLILLSEFLQTFKQFFLQEILQFSKILLFCIASLHHHNCARVSIKKGSYGTKNCI